MDPPPTHKNALGNRQGNALAHKPTLRGGAVYPHAPGAAAGNPRKRGHRVPVTDLSLLHLQFAYGVEGGGDLAPN